MHKLADTKSCKLHSSPVVVLRLMCFVWVGPYAVEGCSTSQLWKYNVCFSWIRVTHGNISKSIYDTFQKLIWLCPSVFARTEIYRSTAVWLSNVIILLDGRDVSSNKDTASTGVTIHLISLAALELFYGCILQDFLH